MTAPLTTRDALAKALREASSYWPTPLGCEECAQLADALLSSDFFARLAKDEALVDAVSRALASLESGEEWPTNEELGGSMTGTRDDEYRWAKREEATDALTALAAALPAQNERVEVQR